MSDCVLQLQNIVKIYRPAAGVEVQALRGVSLDIRHGEYVAIVGPSGSGKSTLMNIIGCLDHPTSGTYILDGADVSTLADDELSDIRGQRIGFVFQSFNLIATQTILENLETPLFYQGVPPLRRRELAQRLLDKVGLGDRHHHLPHELSGGQQQRVAIARALVNDPAILLADEPTGNLDSKTGVLILNMLDELNRQGRTVIIVTHDSHVALHCPRIIEIRDGLIRERAHAELAAEAAADA